MGKLIVLMITAFVDMVGFSMILPLIPFYASKLGATGALVGVILAAFSVAQLLSAPGWGRFSDRFGRRPAILTGLLISAVAYIVFGFAESLAVLLISRFVQGIGGGTVGVLQAYVADAMHEDDRAKSLGWLSASTSFGVVIGPALGSFLTLMWGRRAPGIGGAALCVAVSVFAFVYLREAVDRSTAERRVPRRAGASATALLRVIQHAGEPAPRLIWIYTLAIGAFYGTGQLLPLLLADHFGVTEKTVGWFFMYFGLMGVLIRALLLGPLVRRLREARLSRLGLVLLAAGLVLAAFSRSYILLFISFTLMPLGTAFVFPCVTALLTRVVSVDERGLYMGVQQTYGGLARVAFPVVTGLFLDRFGAALPFAVAGAIVVAALPLTSALDGYLGPAATEARAAIPDRAASTDVTS